MVWDWRSEEDGEVLDSSSARWSLTASISISASAVAERTESMAAGPGPTSRATEASYVELVGSGVKVGRFRTNGEQKPFAQAELQSPPTVHLQLPCPPAPSCSLLLAPSTSHGRRPHRVRSNGHKDLLRDGDAGRPHYSSIGSRSLSFVLLNKQCARWYAICKY
ncbi:hypothetical protein C2845_PM12G06490 [Panicum miliaceum]|uniref:Uncharacterized protein n=1 Tax=Panicum miliaceum TaxID=4540 RepID=A0A3L6QH86_PANMI|nr:hypothetical protein C2845_PM12G06490 [Panicum miliaceum]